MLRVLASLAAFMAIAHTPAFACRVAPRNPPTIIFEQAPSGVRADLIVLQVVFEDVDAFPSRSRPRVGRARIERVLQGTFRPESEILVRPMPFSGACQAEVSVGQRGYIVGRVQRVLITEKRPFAEDTSQDPDVIIALEPFWVGSPETWRQLE